MKYGFMLIELIVSTLIASMIGSLLLTALYQSGRFQRSIDTMFDTSLRVGIVTNQLEKDFMGAFVPMQARIKDTDEDEDSAITESKTPTNKNETKKSAGADQEDKQEKVSKPAEKPLEKIFYSTNKGANLDTVTFVTNNPLTVFVGKDVGEVKPKIVRVQYVLKPDEDKEKKDTFSLIRQESTELDLAKYGGTRGYELVHGIKSFVVTYTARIEKKEENGPDSAKATSDRPANKTEGSSDKKSSQPKKPVVYEYKTSKEWVSEQKKEENKQAEGEEQEFPRIPYLIEIKMVLWNMQHSKDEEFTLMFELPVDTSVSPRKKEQGKGRERKSEQKAPKSDGDATADKKPDEAKQAQSDVNTIVDSLTVTLGNLTKMFGKL